MDLLFELDRKNYNSDCTETMERKASRAIIIKNGQIYMVHSRLYDFFKFPGGGLKYGEDYIDALIREVKEETGLQVIKESIKEFGYTIEKHALDSLPDTIFIQRSNYYLADVLDEVLEQNLDDYESDYEFVLVKTSIDDALIRNNYYNNHSGSLKYIEREEKVLEILKNTCNK